MNHKFPWQNSQLIYLDKHTCTDEKCPAGMMNFIKWKFLQVSFTDRASGFIQSSERNAVLPKQVFSHEYVP